MLQMTEDVKNLLQTESLLKDRVGLLTLGGSLAYGTNLPGKGDIDTRGFAFEHVEQVIGGVANFETYVHKESDTVVYSFSKVVSLLLENNPNTLEIFGCKPEHYIFKGSVGQEICENLDKFLSHRAFYTFGGYAKMQLERMENAMLQDTMEERKKLEHLQGSLERAIFSFNERYSKFEFGSIAIRLMEDVDGVEFDVLLDLDMKGYPLNQVAGMLQELSSIKHMYNKLSHRGKKKDAEHLDKHAMHIIRLLYTGNELLETGQMHTYREKERELLLDIRKGKYRKEDGTYNSAFYDLKNELDKRFNYAKEYTVLSECPNKEWIQEFMMKVNKQIIMGELDILHV